MQGNSKCGGRESFPLECRSRFPVSNDMTTISLSEPPPKAEGDEKLGELIIHIAKQCQAHVSFGAVKLNKILFFADRLSYLRRGHTISGADYMREKFGPVPRRMLPVRERLVHEKAISIENSQAGSHKEKRTVPLRAPVLDGLFSAEDIQIVDEVIKKLRHLDARTLSDLSHGNAWSCYTNGETIPFSAYIVSDRKPSAKDLAGLVEALNKHSICA